MISIAYLWLCFDPDFSAGTLRWRANGKPALAAFGNGYAHGTLDYKDLKRARVLFAMFHGYWPKVVDHLDGNPGNDTLDNLRDVSRQINSRNVKARKGRDGVTGVSFHQKSRDWLVFVGRKYLGRRKDFAEAVQLRRQGEIGMGFTERHGGVC